MPITKERQYRSIDLKVATDKKVKEFDSEYYVEGYATTFGKYVLFDGEDPIFEEFERGAFENCDMSDVIFQFDHEGKVYARMSNNTLKVRVDEKGLFIAADLSKTESARQMYEEIESGLVTKMSWGFRVGDCEFNDKENTYIHKSVDKIYDVSAVSIPANADTSINARSFMAGVSQKVKAERLKRAKLKLKIKLNVREV